MTAEAADKADAARRAVAANPRDSAAHRALGRALRAIGDDEGANRAELAAIDAAQHDPQIQRAATAMMANDIGVAEAVLRPLVEQRPDDVAALRMLADVSLRLGRPLDAERLLHRALELAPGFDFARFTLAVALHQQNRSGEAIEQLDLISGEKNDELISLRAGICSRIGRYDEAAALYRDLLSRHSTMIELWTSLGNVLKFAGDNDGAVAAYRRIIALRPEHGEAWWSLADLKTFSFSKADIAAMEDVVATAQLGDDDRLRIHFALGKAYEDLGQDDRSFDHYAKGNAIRCRQLRHDPEKVTELVAKIEQTVTSDLLESRSGSGCQARDPIFILGMPRAGSTLVEQILASHPQIEGTAELPDIIVLARALEEAEGKFTDEPWERYPAILADLSAAELKELGALYLERTRVQRHTQRPFFTDKMPNNWIHVGLIRLILPNAKIVDVRRHPLACGFSNFKQHYARGQEFSYDLGHFGNYYRDYVRLMRHFDIASPGGIYRLIYEDIVQDPRREVGRLLDYLGLPFDEACMRFHETKRVVRTASAQQVRRPINSSGLDQWRRFEKWLSPLREALGPALDNWRE